MTLPTAGGPASAGEFAVRQATERNAIFVHIAHFTNFWPECVSSQTQIFNATRSSRVTATLARCGSSPRPGPRPGLRFPSRPFSSGRVLYPPTLFLWPICESRDSHAALSGLRCRLRDVVGGLPLEFHNTTPPGLLQSTAIRHSYLGAWDADTRPPLNFLQFDQYLDMGRTKTQRRSKGEGTIYKTIVRGKTVWRSELQWTDQDGFEQRRSAQRLHQSAAKAVLDRWRLEKTSKGTVANQSQSPGQTFSEYSAKWLARRKPEIAANTYRQYESNLHLRLQPFFKGLLLKRIREENVTAFLGAFQSSRNKGARDGETGETTRKQCLGLLKQILTDASEDGFIEKMPFRSTGRRAMKMRVEPREMHALDAATARLS